MTRGEETAVRVAARPRYFGIVALGSMLLCALLAGATPAQPDQDGTEDQADLSDDDNGSEEAQQEPSQPCLEGGRYDDFDFWIGDWDVMVRGKKRAENLITKEMNGCIIRERFRNEQGYDGESINYYDPGTRTWKQNWVDAQGGVVRYEGKLRKEGVMFMEGWSTSADGEEQMAKVTWTLLPDGRVHHVIEQSANRGYDWKKFFDALYVKSDRSQAETGP